MKRNECVNLKERFGRRFKVLYCEDYHAQYGPRATTIDPWYMLIPCVGGEIYPHGGDTLAAFLRAGPRAERLKRLPRVQVKTEGSDGTTVLFQVGDFDRVAGVMQPRRRRTRQAGPEERQSLLARLERANKARALAVQSNPTGQIPTRRAGAVLGALQVVSGARGAHG